jgi:hypothetical protein
MLPEEINDLIQHLVDRFGLHVVLRRLLRGVGFEAPGMVSILRMSDGKWADQVILGMSPLDPKWFNEEHLGTGRYGLIICDMPIMEDKSLSMGRIATKSEWYDAVSGERGDNLATISLFRKIAPHFKRHLQYPTWVYHKITGESWPDRRLGHSNGAETWIRCGGSLCQRGVLNLKFAPSLDLIDSGA